MISHFMLTFHVSIFMLTFHVSIFMLIFHDSASPARRGGGTGAGRYIRHQPQKRIKDKRRSSEGVAMEGGVDCIYLGGYSYFVYAPGN